MSDIGGRIRAARAKIGISQQAMADRLGVSARTYIRYEQGATDPTISTITQIADMCGVEFVWLATGVAKSSVFDGTQLVVLPILDLGLTAGRSELIGDVERLYQIALPSLYLRDVLRVNPEHAGIVVVLGDGIIDAGLDGDLLIVDGSVRQFLDDSVYIVRMGAYTRVRSLRLRLDGTLVVASDNPRYPEELIAPGRLDQVAIVGRVAGRLGRLNGSRIP